MDGRTGVAVAGIAATAIVGIAGAALGWVTSRDDRATQMAVAHEARVYDKRAAAYLDAMQSAERQYTQLSNEEDRLHNFREPHFFLPEMASDAGINVYVHMLAFGSPSVVRAYGKLRQIALKLTVADGEAANGWAESSAEDRAATIDKLIGDTFIPLLGRNDDMRSTFYKRVADELR